MDNVRDEIRLVGIHQPRFRGDTNWGLLVGGVWAIVFGGLIATISTHQIFLLVVAVFCWVWGIWLLRRWSILHAGIIVLLDPKGYLIAPRTREPGPPQAWTSGLEITFTRTSNVWSLQIAEGLRRHLDAIFPNLSDSDMESIRTRLANWQSNRIFVEKL